MSFDNIVGQDGAVARLRRALRAARVAHAYLFTGPRGVGKMTTALEFARALMCKSKSDDACGRCAACRKVEHGVHPDVHRVEPADKGRIISIKAFRDRETGEGLLKDLSLKPQEGRHKVVLIDDAHRMMHGGDGAANCLLKTLEEPDAATVFVLVTPRPDMLVETILSRCQAVRFRHLSADLIEGQLTARHVDQGLAKFLALASDGSLGRALELAGDTKLLELRKQLIALLCALHESNLIDSASRFARMMRDLLDSRAEPSPDAEVEPSAPGERQDDRRARGRSAAELLLDIGVRFYHDVRLRQLGVELARLPSADLAAALEPETRLKPAAIRGILDTMEEAKAFIGANVDADAVVLDAFSTIAAHRTRQAAARPVPAQEGT